MKHVVLATVIALLLGLGLGVVIERDRQQRGPRESAPSVVDVPVFAPDSASADRIAALEAELERTTARLEALEARPLAAGPRVVFPPSARPSAETGPELEAMRAELAALIAKRDGAGLVFLARRLAALGEPGFPSIMEIAKLLIEDLQKIPPEFGDFSGGEEALFGEDCGPLMAWALAHPDLSPPAYRSGAIDTLTGRSDLDVAHLFLAALRTETDADIVAHLCVGIANRMRAGIMEDVEAAARSLNSNGKAIDSLLNGLVQFDETAATAALKRLAADEIPEEVRDRARATLTMRSPPDTGYLMLGVESGSGWHKSGLRTGDIILDVNGKSPRPETKSGETVGRDGKVTTYYHVSDPVAGIAEDETVEFRVLRDGETRTVTVQGNDSCWRGVHVEKAE